MNIIVCICNSLSCILDFLKNLSSKQGDLVLLDQSDMNSLSEDKTSYLCYILIDTLRPNSMKKCQSLCFVFLVWSSLL